jgi:hypothetical protein
MTSRASRASIILSAILIPGGLAGCEANGYGVQIDYPSDSYDEQAEMCVDLVTELVDWVGRDGVRATLPAEARTIYLDNGLAREFAGTIESEGDPGAYDWTCEVRLLEGMQLQASLTALEPIEAS